MRILPAQESLLQVRPRKDVGVQNDVSTARIFGSETSHGVEIYSKDSIDFKDLHRIYNDLKLVAKSQALSIQLHEINENTGNLVVKDSHAKGYLNGFYEEPPTYTIALKLQQHVPVEGRIAEANVLKIHNDGGEFASVLHLSVPKAMEDANYIAYNFVRKIQNDKHVVLATLHTNADEIGRFVTAESQVTVKPSIIELPSAVGSGAKHQA